MDVHGTLDEEVPANKTKSYDGWYYVLNGVITKAWAGANGCYAAADDDDGSGGGGGDSGVFARRYETKGVSSGDGSELDLWCSTTEVSEGVEGDGEIVVEVGVGGAGAGADSPGGGGCDYAPVVRCSWRGYHQVPPFAAELAWRFARKYTRSGLDAAATAAAAAGVTQQTQNSGGGRGRRREKAGKRALGPMLRSVAMGFAVFVAMSLFYAFHLRRRRRALKERLARMERVMALSDGPGVVATFDETRASAVDAAVGLYR
jgi:hypothetical protein